MKPDSTFPAGWALRGFSLDELTALVSRYRPPLLELSKDFLDDNVSLKGLAWELDRLRETTPAELVLAGTTDLVRCAQFSWDRYRRYLAVQVAQARFLGCTGFRLMVGPSGADVDDHMVIERIEAFCDDLAPMQACVEIHGGIESAPAVLAELLDRTPIKVVVDLENMRHAGLTSDELHTVLPLERIAYFHTRNLPPVWEEDPESLDEQITWQRRCSRGVFLWEPKTVDEPRRIQEAFVEYRTAD